MADDYRKIELQSPEDLRYLVDTARRAATEKIDKALPQMNGETEDTLRVRVEELVHEYITKTFTWTSQNIEINGLPATNFPKTMEAPSSQREEIEEFEAYDQKLISKRNELLKKEENLMIDIAELRRTQPAKASELWKAELKGGMETDEEMVGKWEVQKDEGLGIGSLERQGAVEDNWRRGLNGLGKLNRGLPKTVAKAEEAKKVEEYLLNGK